MQGKGVYAGLFERLRSGFTIALLCYVLGVLSFYGLGCAVGMNARHGRSAADPADDVWTMRHCLYAVGITFTTIGYADVLGTDEVKIYRDPRTGHLYAYNSHDGLVPSPGAPAAGRREDLLLVADYSTVTILATLLVAFVGMGAFIYGVGAVTAFFVEGGYVELRMRMRTQNRVSRMRDHVIVCGVGSLGLHAVDRFVAEGTPLVAIDNGDAHLDRLREHHPGILYLRGDATDLEVLHEAGLDRARGVVTALSDDNDNLVVVVTARQENPSTRILSRAQSRESAERLRRAGAHDVVAAAMVGGMRLASEAIRPTVVRFLDLALGHEETREGFRFAGLRVPAGSPCGGRTLGEIAFGEATGLRVLALRDPGEKAFRYNPAPGWVIREGTELAVVATGAEIERARAFLAGRAPGSAAP
jgi:voltage-gated potassium channel